MRKAATCGWRKLHNSGRIDNLYTLTNITGLMKSRRMRWAGHVAYMGDNKNAYRVLVGKPEGGT
jgi:hypothetical protein